MGRLALFILAFLALGSPAWATTYWTSATGGTGSTTCSAIDGTSDPNVYARTIATGLGCLSAGDTLIVKDGTYTEAVSAFVSGTSVNAPTIVKAQNIHGAVIRPSSGTFSVQINNKRFVVFDGFVVDGVNTSSQGIRLFGTLGTADIILQNLEVKNVEGTESDASGTCIATDHAPRVKIINALIHDCGAGDTDGHSHGVYISGTDTLLEHTEIYNITGHGVHQFRPGMSDRNNNVIRYNYVHNTTSRTILIGSGQNNIAHGNIVRDGTTGIAIGFNSPVNNQVYNNTVYSSNGSCVHIRNGTGGLVKNNWCLSNTGTILNEATGTVGACGTFGNVCNTSTTHAIDVANNRFSPSETGAATLVDAGVTISTAQYSTSGKFVGAAPDVGALEAPIFLSASVEDGDANKVRINFSNPSQNVIDGVGFGSCGGGSLTYYAAIFDGVANTETACAVASTIRIDLTVGTAMQNGDTPNTIAYTRGSTASLRGNACVGFKSSATCLQPEVRTFSAQTITNNVGGTPAGASVALARYQCMSVYGTLATPQLTGTMNEPCQTAPGGYFALLAWIQATGADPASITLEAQYDKNGAATWAALTDDPLTHQISFGQHSQTTLIDGETINVNVGGQNPQSTLVNGKVVGKQTSSPTADLSENSAMPVIILGRLVGATPGTGCGADYFDLRLVLQGGTTLDAGLTPRVCVRHAAQSLF